MVEGCKLLKAYHVNGEWVESETEEYGDVWCPATGEKIGEVPFPPAEDVDKAVQAKKAYQVWRRTSPLTRARCFFKLKNFLIVVLFL
jgi:malonate-semialdehyde dehydrogenase (acetylating)/methylmalonate-semialdehyde dehydrogenase